MCAVNTKINNVQLLSQQEERQINSRTMHATITMVMKLIQQCTLDIVVTATHTNKIIGFNCE